MLTTRVVSWTLDKLRCSNYVEMRDMTNAFACTTPAMRNDAITELFHPLHRSFARQRVEQAVIEIQGSDGTVEVLPGCGNQIGSSEGPLLFSLPYSLVLDDWWTQTRELVLNIKLQAPSSDTFTEGGLQTYAYDVFQRILLWEHNAHEA